MQRNHSYYFLLFAVVALSGCGQNSTTDPYGPGATPADFSQLKLSRTVNDPRVKNELDRLEIENSLPSQIAQLYQSQTDETSEEPIFNFLRGTDAKTVEEALTDSAHWWNPNSPGRDLLVSNQGQDFLAAWDMQRKAGRNVLLQPRARFPVDLESGILADPSWTSTIHCLARAELLEAANQARQNNMSEAVTAAAYALAYADQLNQVPTLPARNSAAAIREETLITLRALLRHPQFSAGQLRTLETVLNQTMQRWPSDTELWKADRASGLHFLEMIRAGHLASLLTREEYDGMMASGEFAKLSSSIARNLTTDQAFYLDAMKDIVAAADKPYYQRANGLAAIADALNVAQTTDKYPIVSGDFLLSGMHAQQANLSKDKSRMTIWLAAVQTANGHPPGQMPVIDFSGRPVEIRDEPGRVVASFEGIPGEIPNLVIPKFDSN
ncbi:hypothetical protein Pan97_40950 [Bremerella volcania]|uniref:Uncharacterized protein n=1 Tax=Bremerella volcania TaxID=2527984 RepID=A0A518CCT3_9BACT|nr:hypothetical protein [Bremerella volcania]QDU77035.1 hypothetical protein Pan97_40950 [Bremerella volcania]